ncbi:uncharacterized protein LOC127247695 [Andrographis paniculata]|uniref:uncharacterized protein LOC127247695 n=1 Tax=Andrographis paniculata TaxID=175694 RepID=UPI0021E7A0B4|nr:uncharacterized protein LOC127247695 [Andrographis paniculata]
MGDPHNAFDQPPNLEETEELERLEHAAPFWTETKSRKRLSKQLSMHEAPRYRAWERRRRRILDQERNPKNTPAGDDNLTDDDLKELKGCIELGFGFKEESGQQLCPTIPALDLYFAVNRQVWTGSPLNSPSSSSGGGNSACSVCRSSSAGSNSSSGSPMSDSESSLKIFNPGDDPQQVKTRLRHWAQAVACSVLQSPLRGGEMDYAEKER